MSFPPDVIERKKTVFKTMKTWLKVLPLEEASGFFIDQNTFVTNFHTIAHWKSLPPKFPFSIDILGAAQHLKYLNLASIRLTGVRQLSLVYDLALLKTSEPVPEEFVLKPGKPTNKNIYIIGYPSGVLPLVRKFSGRIITQNSFEILMEVNSSRSSFGGASGSPMLNEKGEVVGVFSKSLENESWLSGAPIEHVVRLQEQPDLSDTPLEDLVKQEINNLRALAESGDPLAQFTLGDRLMEGEILKQNTEDAVKWLKRAAMQNQLHASARLASYFSQAILDLEKKFWIHEPPEKEILIRECYRWLLKAAELGDMRAQHHLALFKIKGYGSKKNPEEAVDWLFKAAAQGYSKSYKALSGWAGGKSISPHLQNKIESYLKTLNGGEINSCPRSFSNPQN